MQQKSRILEKAIWICGFFLCLGTDPCHASQAVLPFSYLQQGILIVSAAQTLYPNVCSSPITLQSNFSGKASNPKSTLTYNFATTGTLSVYSDPACNTAVTTLTQATTSSSSTIWVMATATGANSFTITATGGNFSYLPVSQNYTSVVNPYVWIGGTSNVWSTGSNWSGGAAPGNTNVAYFDNTCTTFCSPNMTSNTSVGGIKIMPSYAGTITQNAGITLSIAGIGFVQRGGTFVGSSTTAGTITITQGPFFLTGGTFTSTAGTFSMAQMRNYLDWYISGTPTFNHNNGLIFITGPTNVGQLYSIASVVYNNFQIDYECNPIINGTFTINGNLTLTSDSSLRSIAGTGTVNITGNILIPSGNGFAANNTSPANLPTFNLVGSSNQKIDATGSSGGSLPNVQISSTGGTVSLIGTLNITGNYTVTSGTVAPDAASTINFNTQYSAYTFTPGSEIYNNVSFNTNADSGVTMASTLKVNGLLTLNGTNATPLSMTGGAINAYGNVTILNRGISGSTPLNIVGSTNQTITGGASIPTNGGNTPELFIASTGGTVSFTGIIAPSYKYTYTSGTVSAGTSLLYLAGGTAVLGITAGSPTYYDVTVQAPSGRWVYIYGSIAASHNITLGTGGETIQMPSTGGPYSITSSGGNVTVTATTTLNKNGSTVTISPLVNNGTINP